ncbi:sensor histidine kinase [Paenibacillus whitsoniae]|uniref:HAMP domain-containing protein n=1 Tax=Paenibacillus whitsoniae TaxID=2496558 RepID=A0A430JIQ9_9BACL|nr:histidine kinase [Paenibacillus whitsoniae]RTE10846.1 HAMP domain-containing protein [Paenibacillus whitsoniae]
MTINKRQLFFSLRLKFLLAFTLFIVAPILFMLYIYFVQSDKIFLKQMTDTQTQVLKRVTDRADDMLNRTLNVSNLLTNDYDVLQLLRSTGQSNLDDYPTYQRVIGLQSKMDNLIAYILDNHAIVAVYGFNGSIYTTNQDEAILKVMPDYVNQAKEKNGAPAWGVTSSLNIKGHEGNQEGSFITMVRLIRGETTKGYGLVFIAFPIKEMFPVSSGLEEDSPTQFLISDHNRLLWGRNDLWNRTQSGEEPSAFTQILKATGWQLRWIPMQEQWVQQLKNVRSTTTWSVIVVFASFLFIYVIFTLRLMKPIRSLVQAMGKASYGNFEKPALAGGNDEIGLLSHHFNRMLSSLKEMVATLREEQQLKEEARFHALQAQISPHFLFNALNSIKWLALFSGAKNVGDMITSLGIMLSYSMKQESEVVTLRDELDFIQHYFSLQKIRFNDNIELSIDVDENLMSARILKFTLQPIVENSIIHGNRMPLIIRIAAYYVDDLLFVTIADNGQGLSERKLSDDDDFECADPIRQGKYSGIGLENVQSRIRMHFGEPYGLFMHNGIDAGAETVIKLPWKRMEDPA